MDDISLTPLGIVILGLLAERPMHPYEMYQLASVRRGDQLVKIKPGSLYHTVGRLEQQKLLASIGTDREGNRPERTTYEITAWGRAALEHQLREMLAVPVREYPRLPIALAEMHNLSADAVCELLRTRIAHLDASIAEFDTRDRPMQAEQKPRIFTVGVDYVRAMTVAEREWLSALVEDIESGELPWLSPELLDRLAGTAGSGTPTKD
ncbi:PadR family transcriptional regulator [Rhodococcus sp. IEGM 1379]|uniref:PadR family transcriptional regulator n=1 Tax=Rhodococcus sp. IEGM 1379 TaxID=3047086 RepID=UPI0024B7683D|nr:PadR family transcriptional regulator [Rhodococcus sp. IEGM 1379]MDI9915730.1 PadR family transcriptional regulator [Rhodococcus sp. IEGM 1379]